ncbi:FKBP-type peptidyl-prolyl cis-trans isomerase [Bernardetia sp.]|uniref:FKBP-type peptidyl-prolyl cis-trans isomerase n=1 Tax=Bernardetia sp. TaxID=1937974 RepID=UPI0025B9B0A2|nr:FKBP-type peptidyl-prolyl cis-trans isomerase [Bernardetia sp.]
MKLSNIILLFIGFVFLASCKKEEENPSSLAEQDQILQDYFATNNINPQKTESGLYYVVDEQGSPIQNGETIRVHYEGKLLTTGEIFDSSFSRGTPFSFPVGTGQVIQGWDEGIPLIGKGGKGTLYIPSHLGYGSRSAGSAIKPYSILIFRVEVFN